MNHENDALRYSLGSYRYHGGFLCGPYDPKNDARYLELAREILRVEDRINETECH